MAVIIPLSEEGHEPVKHDRGAPGIFKSRFPSRTDVFYVYPAFVIPVFLWAILSYLDAFPGFALRLTFWDLIGTASYVLASALFESLVLLLPFVVLGAILPRHLFKDHFVALASTVVLISSVWMMYANFRLIDLARLPRGQLLTGLAMYLISLAIPVALVLRYQRIEHILESLMQRLAVLAYLYVGFACLGVVIVVLRNL